MALGRINLMAALAVWGLTRPVSAATITWDGGCAGDLWTTGQHRVGDIAPVLNDNAAFRATGAGDGSSQSTAPH